MKRHLVAGLLLSMLASTAAFAGGGGGIGRAGTYNDYSWAHIDTQHAKTRAEVHAELVQAYRDGSLPALSRNSYPDKSLIARTQAERLAIQSNDEDATRLARDQKQPVSDQ
ncbi:DUF4148 domain-containing protein [Paraburkholderia sp.]|uniref:DUF4148 domain-containing protein n=1 Tax=Paraburkholderia sp. TaxID=1926495 RepID=UPI003D6E6834